MRTGLGRADDQTLSRIVGQAKDLLVQIQLSDDRMAVTANNTGMVLSVALNYGGRAEILQACQKAAEQVINEGRPLDQLSEADIERFLYTYGLPEVDLLIRTSGEFRISNFLLWQLAYSEIYVTPTLFPDFRRPAIFEAIIDYQTRERRFGDIK